MDIKNKTVIITGASSGIGEATALKLSKEGANVVLTARREDRLKELKSKIEKEGGKAIVVVGDVTNKNDWQHVQKEAKDTFGSIDVLVNNAGLMPLSYVKNLHTDEWEKMVDVNIKGVLNGVSAVLPTMIDQKKGHIVNISSVAAYKYFPGGAIYCATKSAVKMFSEGLRQELAPNYGINVTSIEPGAVDTELTETITDKELMNDMKDVMGDVQPLEPNDIADAIFYAVSQPERTNINDVYVMPTTQKQ
ncbi:MAG: SDR family oxidoreductase [Marinirhabdus sp.]|nr:SDR family oxidoreductase [Marinirhabdus sp.]